MTILLAQTEAEYQAAAMLFKAYQLFLGVDLCFQGFEQELQQLPQMYGPPGGALLLAKEGEDFIGCVGLRTKGNKVGEMKRLFVTDGHKGKGTGKLLALAIIEKATEMGFETLVLDTLEHLQPAMELYRNLGFSQISAYYQNPLPEVVYWQLALIENVGCHLGHTSI